MILSIAPEVHVIDITHGISPQDILRAAIVLAQSVQFVPLAAHLAVVDPGVGSSRLPVIIETRDGSSLVGPDNGLLTLAAEKLGGAVTCYTIANPDLALPRPSRTFQGRDVFAPAAAHVARGVALETFGPQLAYESLVSLTLPKARRHGEHLHGTVLLADRFGNLQLNLTPAQLAEVGLSVGSLLEVQLEGRRTLVRYGETFISVPEGEPVLTEDSHGRLALAVNRGSAADRLGAAVGSSVIMGPPGSAH